MAVSSLGIIVDVMAAEAASREWLGLESIVVVLAWV
jgi:hypothetical protein